MSSANIQKNILSTLAYYDVMDYPMTSFEIWKYLTVIHGSQSGVRDGNEEDYSLLNIINGLESENLRKFIEKYRGFYFLKGRQDLVGKRLWKNKLANEKLRIAAKVTNCLRFVPFVRSVSVTGSLAMKNTDQESDLDLLVILKHGKIFTGRTLVTAGVHLLGKRRHGGKITDRICLNYFITTESLEINLKDFFSASEYSWAFPVFGFRVFRKFQARNSWIKKHKPNFQTDQLAGLKVQKDNYSSKFIRKAGEKIFDFGFIEESLKEWQTKRIARDPRTKKDGSMVVANDDMLVFLPEPQGPKIFEKFKKRLESLNG